MRVVEEFEIQRTCNNCNTKIAFLPNDEAIDSFYDGRKFVKCPVCGSIIYLPYKKTLGYY